MHILLIAFVSFFALTSVAFANNETATAQKIKSLQNSITLLESRLSRQKKDAKDLGQTLKATELRIAKINKQLKALDQQLARLGSHAGKLEARRDELRAELKRRGDVIARQLRAQYKMGDRPWLQAFLMQEDPDEFARMMTYFGTVNTELLAQIETFRERLDQLSGTENELGATEQEMVIKRRQLGIESANLRTAQNERKSVLAELELEIARDSKRLKQMQTDQARLAELLETLQDTIEQLSLERDGETFSSLRGKLEWPVKGKILRSYGSRPDKVGYDGIWIAANRGDAVRAVHHGRVVFSSWLDG
ncbi:MAG: murein hydrolase activator EnvC family protein, partial [Pontibacterium sp.]